MKKLWIFTISAALLCISAGYANPTDKKGSKKGKTAARTAQPNDLPQTQTTVSDTTGVPTGPIVNGPLMFGGELLTQARAEQLVTPMGFTLVDFHRCSTGTNCAIFEVVGPAGRIYQYQVLGERCKVISSGGTVYEGGFDRPDLSSASARKAQRANKSARSAPPTTGGTVGTSTTPVKTNPNGILVEEPGNVSSCFAGYKILFRARQENTLYADSLGFSTKVQQFYQTVENGRWLDLFNMSSSNWRFARVGSGLTDQGWAHETRYANGTLRSGASEAWSMIASSGGAGQTPAELCGANRDVLQANANVTVTQVYAACKAVPLPGSATIGGEVSLEPFGVGGSVSGSITKTNDTCANFKDIAVAKIAASGAAYYSDCIQHPGRYFPNLFPPEGGTLSIDAIQTAIKPQFFENGSVSASYCPASIVNNNVTVDMGNGLFCTADAVRYTCNTTTTGSCECTDPKIEGAITCTGPAN